MALPSVSDVNGPEAKITVPSVGIDVTSSWCTVILGWLFILSVTIALNRWRSTAKAPPAGTAVASAHSIINEPNRRISSFSRPTAFSILPARKELLQTSSANWSVWWAGELFTGRISYKSTATPRLASCHAASEPANPAPITVTLFSLTLSILFFLYWIIRLFLSRFLRWSSWTCFIGAEFLRRTIFIWFFNDNAATCIAELMSRLIP